MSRHITANTLFYGDNLPVLREHISSESVDLVYLDPPFNSNRNYNILYKDESGKEADAQVQAFEDSWSWNQAAEYTYRELVTTSSPHVAQMIGAMKSFLGTSQMSAYLVMMAARLVELHRALKPTGSLYLHCDPTASHYLKIILDTIFGARNYRSEITWLRSKNPKGSQHQSKRYSPDTDILLYYAKSDSAPLYSDRIKKLLSCDELIAKYDRVDEIGRFTDGPIVRSASMGDRPNLVYEYRGYTPGPWGWRVSKELLIEIDRSGNLGWTSNGQPYRKLRMDEDNGHPIGSCWTDIASINPQAAERLGYPTQKPLALLERIINASSNPGDVILDPFCGCGTAIAAAEKLGRRWLGIDITHLAISIQKSRLKEMFPGIAYNVIGEPLDVASARVLAQQDRYQFQWWALSLVQARPLGGEQGSKQGKKGSDRGIDGIIPFIDEPNGKPKRALVQVKSGNVKSGDIRDLRGTIEREGAPLGGFITLDEPTSEMRREAAAAGVYRSPGWNRDYPRLQILTVKELLHGAELRMPPIVGPFKTAQRADGDDGQQPLPW